MSKERERAPDQQQRRAPPGRGSRPDGRLIRTALASGGEPLPEDLRERFAAPFGRDLGQVRVHTGPDADAAARTARAKAFTVGPDILFGSGHYSPQSEEGRRLLAHEVAHVVQQSGAGPPQPIPDEPGLSRPGQPAEREAEQAAEAAMQGQPASVTTTAPGGITLHRTPEEALGYTTADVQGLSDVSLLSEIEDTQAYLDTQIESNDETIPYQDYQAMLLAEKRRRVGQGKFWLADPEAGSAEGLIQLVPNGDTTAVVATGPGATVQGGAMLITARQFERLREQHGIPTIGLQEALASARGSHLHQPAFESQLPSTFARPVSGQRHLQTGFTGEVTELSLFRSRYRGLFSTDLNATSPNFAIMDGIDPLWGPVQSKASARAQQSGRVDYAMQGWDDISRRGGASRTRRVQLFDQAAQDIFPSMSAADAQARTLLESHLAVNADDVGEAMRRIAGAIGRRPSDYTALLDAMLTAEPERVGSQTFSTLSDLNTALTNGAITQAEHQAALARLGERCAERVVTHGLTTAEIQMLQGARSARGLGAASPSPEVLASQHWPEWFMVERYGMAGATRRAATTGAGMGGIIAVVMHGGVMLIDTREHPDWARELAVTGGLGTVGGAGQAAIEMQVGNAVSRTMISRGLAGRGFVSMGRAGGGALAGGIIAPIVEMGSMALDGEEHSTEDYAARGTRAGVGGALSGALAAGVVGAIWGTEVPVAGNIAGFVIGFGGYLIYDWLAGDAVEESVRGAMH